MVRLLVGLALLLTLSGCGGVAVVSPVPVATVASAAQPSPTVTPSPTTVPSTPTATRVIPSATPVTTPTLAVAPSPTPPPTPSPTAAATPTPGPTATATLAVPVAPTPTGSPAYPVASVFGKINRDYPGGFMGAVTHNYPGAPVEPARETKLSEQPFGHYFDGFCGSRDSFFLWREDTRQIYFLVVGNVGLHMEACRDFWEVFPDTWKPGDPNNDDLTAPEGAVVPRGGIGKVWRQRFYGRTPAGLGFPSAPERYVVGTVQRFEHATAFYIPDTRAVYVLFDRFEFVTRGGVATRQVWFRGE